MGVSSMRFVVRGKALDGKKAEVSVIDVTTALHAVAKLERDGVTNVRLVETESGREFDLQSILNVRRN